MDRRSFLRQGASLLAGGMAASFALKALGQSSASNSASSPASSPAGERTDQRPDVLFIGVEDTAAYLLSCYGGPAKTPNLEKLAARGVIFDHAYCQAPVCNPARAALITGLRPLTLHVFGNNDDWRVRMPKGPKTIPEYFQQNGYTTACIGKITHNEVHFAKEETPEAKKRQRAMWDRYLGPEGEGGKVQNPGKRPKGEFPKKTDAGGSYVKRACVWGDSGLSEEQEGDSRFARAVEKEIPHTPEKPRFLAVGLSSPHYDLRICKKYLNMYPPEQVKLPPTPKTDMSHLYGAFNTTEQTWLSDEEKREIRAAYWASITFMDHCVGIMLDALKKSGKEDNTIVVFWVDHGFQQGENNLWQKDTMFEASDRVPLLMAGPGIPKGVRMGQLVEAVDLYPTLAQMCGMELPEYLEGSSMVPLFRDPKREWKKAAFTWCHSADNLSMRTEKWRYNEWGAKQKNARELYDHEKDPLELENLADQPEYKEIIEQLHEQMQRGWKGVKEDLAKTV